MVKMLKEFLKEAVVLVIGKQSEGLADLLYSNSHVNEFAIAKKLGVTINQARNMLYKISDKGLVSFIRKKDKKKGWYTYFWKIETLKALEFLKENVINNIEQINNQIRSRELKQFYVCEKCHVEFSEENALLYNFTCPECGSVFVLKDNSSVIKEFRKNLSKFNKEKESLEQEIKKEKEKSEKIKIRGLKKIKRKKGKKISKKKTVSSKAKKLKKKSLVKRKKIKRLSKKKQNKKISKKR